MLEKKIILVVDDNPDNLELLTKILRQEYSVRQAPDGAFALEFCKRTVPDLVLLDIKMPGLDGYEVCNKIKAAERTQGVPIIFLSALGEIDDKVRGFEAGAEDYITKPFQPEEVLLRVRTHLKLSDLQKNLEKHVIELAREIDRRKEAENLLFKANKQLEDKVTRRTEALSRSERQYRQLIEQSTSGIGVIREGKIIFCNRFFAKLMGVSIEKILSSGIAISADEPLRSYFEGICTANNSKDEQTSWQGKHILLTGASPRWLEGSHSAILWENAPAVLTTLRDITEQKQQEFKLFDDQQRLYDENRRLRLSTRDRYKYGSIIGKSLAMQRLYEDIEKTSRSEAPVVITGESGTGKDLVARTIHQFSSRSAHKFIPVNCGSIPEELFESEFFGYKKGAFTGAQSDKPGFFDLADGGVLFLDELGELPLSMQIKLLRAIEGGGYMPVGGREVKFADIRIIAATNRDLKQLVKEGKMREDFYYRINVILLQVPALRERLDDLPLLIEHFSRAYEDEGGGQSVPANVVDILSRQDWPGNVRQLQNTLQRYFCFKTVEIDNVVEPSVAAGSAISAERLLENKLGIRGVLEEIEKSLVEKIFRDNGKNISRTADILILPRKTLYRKLQKHGIE